MSIVELNLDEIANIFGGKGKSKKRPKANSRVSLNGFATADTSSLAGGNSAWWIKNSFKVAIFASGCILYNRCEKSSNGKFAGLLIMGSCFFHYASTYFWSL